MGRCFIPKTHCTVASGGCFTASACLDSCAERWIGRRMAHKQTVQRLMDLACKFRSAPTDQYDSAYKTLQDACYEALTTPTTKD